MSLDTDITQITQQEKLLRFAKLDESDAWALGLVMRELAMQKALPLVMDIRIGTRPLFYSVMPGTTPENPDWVRRKYNTVMRFHKSSYHVGRELESTGKKFDATRGIDPMDYAKEGGGFPIHIIGTGVVGAVTVSGIPQRSDHNFVVEAIAIFLKMDLTKLALGPETL